MDSNCIVAQVHIPPFDKQGDTTAETKKKAIEVGIRHLRRKNPDAYIAFIGHGEEPDSLDLTDWSEWYPYDEQAGTAQQPAQYPYLSKAIKHCKSKGFERILKLRGDGLYGHHNFLDWCHEVSPEKLLITQMTATQELKMGDCVMYGDTDLIDYLWDESHPIHAPDGLIQIGTNFHNYFDNLNWQKLLRRECEFRNITSLKWADLRYNANEFEKLGWDVIEAQLISDTFDYNKYSWGNPHWHVFKDNKMTYSIESYYYEESTFYGLP